MFSLKSISYDMNLDKQDKISNKNNYNKSLVYIERPEV